MRAVGTLKQMAGAVFRPVLRTAVLTLLARPTEGKTCIEDLNRRKGPDAALPHRMHYGKLLWSRAYNAMRVTSARPALLTQVVAYR